MAKKTTELKPFPAAACQKLRNLVELRKQARAKRDDLFKARDAAEDERNRAKPGSQEREHASAVYGDCVLDLKTWERAIKNIDADIDSTVTNADQEEMFPDAQVHIRDYLEEPKKPKDDPDQKQIGEKDDRPVGRVRGREVKHALPDGEDQHLAASVNELDLPEAIKGAMVKQGYTTIGAVAKALDAHDDASEVLNVDPKKMPAVLKAVGKFRSAHRKAAVAAERGE